MANSFVNAVKLVFLVVLLNMIRYAVAAPFEKFLIFDRLFGEMQKNAGYFNTHFTTFDWVTSYFYNFLMWFACSLVYRKMEIVLRGNSVVRSLKVYGLMYLLFGSISAIYMNHYSHPKNFYFYNIADGLIAFAVVALANAFLYPMVFRQTQRTE